MTAETQWLATYGKDRRRDRDGSDRDQALDAGERRGVQDAAEVTQEPPGQSVTLALSTMPVYFTVLPWLRFGFPQS